MKRLAKLYYRSVTNVGSIKLLTIRFFIAAFLIANGILGIHSGVKVSPVDISLFNIIAGSMIFLGFFARVASTAGIVIYTYAAVSHAVGLPPVSPSPEGYGPDFLAIVFLPGFTDMIFTSAIVEQLFVSIFLIASITMTYGRMFNILQQKLCHLGIFL